MPPAAPITAVTPALTAIASDITAVAPEFEGVPVHQFRSRGSNYCVDVTDGRTDERLQLWSCVDGNPNQEWTISANGRVDGSPTTITYGKDDSLCIGIEEEDVRLGAPLRLLPCVGSAITTWRYAQPDALCVWDHENYCIDWKGELRR